MSACTEQIQFQFIAHRPTASRPLSWTSKIKYSDSKVYKNTTATVKYRVYRIINSENNNKNNQLTVVSIIYFPYVFGNNS